MADDFRLLVDFLRHEMAMVALVDQHRGRGGFQHLPLHRSAARVVDRDAVARDLDPVAVFEIADGVGEGRERDRVGAEIHLALAVADRERRALARADQQIVLAREQKGQRESAAQLRKRGGDRIGRRTPLLHLAADQMRHHFGVGLGDELGAVLFELLAQFAVILDDAVMHHRHLLGGMRMRVILGRPAMCRPAGVTDADGAGERLLEQALFQIFQFAFGAAARELPALERGDARGVIAAIFEPLQRIDQLVRDGLAAENPDDPAH